MMAILYYLYANYFVGLKMNEISVESLCAEVFQFISKELSHVNMDDVLKAGKQLESHGTVYQLLALMVAAGTLQGQISLVSMKPLIEVLSQYNNSSVSFLIFKCISKRNNFLLFRTTASK